MAIPPRRRAPLTKSVTCVARSASICGRRSIRRTSSGVMRVCVRCSTTAPARRRRRRATMCLRWRLLPYCRCSAARSPRTDDWPRRQWRSWRGSIPACVAHGRRTPRCRAAIFRGMAVEQVRADLARRYPFLADAQQRRLVRAYGTLAADVLGDARRPADMGRCFGADLTEREIDWLVRAEWARTAEDVLWRRSKLGLRFGVTETRALDDHLARVPAATA